LIHYLVVREIREKGIKSKDYGLIKTKSPSPDLPEKGTKVFSLN
jgi:hypothetical protein